jgi:hypothetical protein
MNFFVVFSIVNMFLLVLAMAFCLRCHYRMRPVIGVWFLVFLACVFGFVYIFLGIAPYYFSSSPVDFDGLRGPVLFVVAIIILCAQYMYSREIEPLRKFLKGGK